MSDEDTDGVDLLRRVDAVLAAPLEERVDAFERLDADLVDELQRLEEV